MESEVPVVCTVCGNSLADPPEGQGRHEVLIDCCLAHGEIWLAVLERKAVP